MRIDLEFEKLKVSYKYKHFHSSTTERLRLGYEGGQTNLTNQEGENLYIQILSVLLDFSLGNRLLNLNSIVQMQFMVNQV